MLDFEKPLAAPAPLLKPEYPSYKSIESLVVMSLFSCMGSAYFGYNQAVFGNLFPPYIKEVYGVQWDTMEYIQDYSLFSACHCVGTMLGAAMSSVIMSKLGRRGAFIFADVCGICAQLLYQIPNLHIAFFSRFCTGFFVGFDSSAVVVFLNETIPTEVAGRFCGFNPIMINTFCLIAFMTGFGISEPLGNYWRWVLAVPILICSARLAYFLLYFKEDTPKYSYIFKGHPEETLTVVRRLYRNEQWVEYMMNYYEREKAKLGKSSRSISSLLQKPGMRLRIFHGCFIMLFQQLVGINSVVFYSHDIFAKVATDSNGVENKFLTTLYGVIFVALNAIFAVFASHALDKFGRKRVIQFGQTTDVISMLLIGLCFAKEWYTPIPILFYIYIFGFNFGLGSAAWVFLAELVPKQGVPLAVFSNWTGDLMVTGTFKYLVYYLGSAWTFTVFGLAGIISTSYITLFVYETLGKTEIDIAKDYGINISADDIDLGEEEEENRVFEMH